MVGARNMSGLPQCVAGSACAIFSSLTDRLGGGEILLARPSPSDDGMCVLTTVPLVEGWPKSHSQVISHCPRCWLALKKKLKVVTLEQQPTSFSFPFSGDSCFLHEKRKCISVDIRKITAANVSSSCRL